MSMLWFLVILLIVLLFVVLWIIKWRKQEDLQQCTPRIFVFNNRFDNYLKSDPLSQPFSSLANNFAIQKAERFDKANLIMFTDYTLYDQHFDKIKYKERCNYKIYAINGIDLLANKRTLAQKLKGSELIPKSYALGDKDDMNSLIKDHRPGSLYIVKKNIQRQEGNLITDDIDFILKDAGKEQYVVVQELLQNPFVFNGRKINMRVYLLIVIKKNMCDWYIYNDGFIYYTPEKFVKGSKDKDANITTGFIDRKVYEENPLTHQDLYQAMGKEASEKLQNGIMKCFKGIYDIYKNELVEKNKKTPGIKFCLYGCDIAPNDNLDVQIIECNKGCSLDSKDDRDGRLKYNMVRDSFSVVNIVEGEPENFMLVNQ